MSLLTVTVICVETRELPAASRALAFNTWTPFDTAVVFHCTEYGAERSSAPSGLSFSRNCTPATPTLSEAVADTVTLPSTVAPSAGADIDTSGGTVSGTPA